MQKKIWLISTDKNNLKNAGNELKFLHTLIKLMYLQISLL